MCTRSLIAIKKRRQQKQENKTKTKTSKTKQELAEAYVRENFVIWQFNLWVGYFSGQGVKIFEFLRKFLDKWSEEQRREYIDNLDRIQDWTQQDSDSVSNWHSDRSKSDKQNLKDPKFVELTPGLSDCGYLIFDILDIKNGHVKTVFTDCDWPLDSIYCEFGYIVDFDESELHVLFCKPKDKFESCELLKPLEKIYRRRGLVLSTTFKFSELPRTADEFVEIVTKNARQPREN